jgi:energy-coupling factor transport system ATP-binding protein
MLLTVRDLAFRYRNSNKPVLRGLNLSLSAGECIAVTGPNGSGKSTLVSILAGIIPAFIDGELTGAITFNDESARPAIALQNPDTQILCDSVEKELLFFLTHSGGCSPAVSPREIAAGVGIEDLLSRRVYQLSYGEKQRLIVACALMCSAGRLVLLDEPSAHLDDDGTTKLLGLLESRKKEGVSIVLIGHECSRFNDLVDRWYHLMGGKLVDAERHCSPIPTAPPPCKSAETGPLPLYSIHNVAYRTEGGETIFSDFNADIHKGKIYGLTGPNGAGKSSLAKFLSGVTECDDGEILRNGKKAPPGTLRRRVKMVGQNPFHQLLYKTVDANLESAYRGRVGEPVFSPERGGLLLGLETLLRRNVATLSFGEAQRVAFLWAILQAPELLIVDESFATLDVAGVAAFREMLSVLRTNGVSIILISQIEQSIAGISDRILYMRRGENAAGR